MRHLDAIVAAAAMTAGSTHAQIVNLPAPVRNGNSFEVLSNSRYTVHSGFASTLSNQVLSNVLWAMNRVPRLGSYREFYVATPTNVYTWDSSANVLNVHLAGNHRYNSGTAFEVGIACSRWEEAGCATQAGLLAGIAFWTSATHNIVCCPQMFATDYANANWNPGHSITMTAVFGQGAATGLVTTVQASSSDGSLPLPSVTGPDTFEVLLSGLHQDSLFTATGLSQSALSQLLWAGYGVTPHTASGSRGLTVPSAYGTYFLTRRIYLVRDTAVLRYNNRTPPGTGLTTSDHRLELVTSGDRRAQLRTACARLPSTAPDYIVVCVGDTTVYGPMVEAGLVGFQYLMQAASLNLGGCLTAPLAPSERSAIITALGIPAADLPGVVFSCGEPRSTAVAENGAPRGAGTMRVIASNNRVFIDIEYSAGLTAASARLTILDLFGRPLRSFDCTRQRRVKWDCTASGGRTVPNGVYFCRLAAGRTVRVLPFVLSR